MMDDDALRSEVETLAARVRELQDERGDLLNSISSIRDGLDELKNSVSALRDEVKNNAVAAEKDYQAADDDDAEDNGGIESGTIPPDETNQHVTVPDSFTQFDLPRKSVELTPELNNVVQLNEFDDAPSVGNLSIKRAGKKLLLTDPDGTSGQRKWMVPLRRETQNAIELKWAQLGEGSDSDSDSDADFPCQDEYTLDESDGDCGTTILLKRQEYIRGSGGVCVPDGSPVVAGSVTVPDPPEYSMSVSGGSCAKTLALYKIPCGGSASQAGDSFTFNVPPEISASATGSSGGGSLAGTVSIIPCGGTQTDINIYNGHDGQNGCTPAVSATSTGSSGGGSLAGTVYVTPCGGTQTEIQIYNGSDASVSGVSDTFDALQWRVSSTDAGKYKVQTRTRTFTITNGLITAAAASWSAWTDWEHVVTHIQQLWIGSNNKLNLQWYNGKGGDSVVGGPNVSSCS